MGTFSSDREFNHKGYYLNLNMKAPIHNLIALILIFLLAGISTAKGTTAEDGSLHYDEAFHWSRILSAVGSAVDGDHMYEHARKSGYDTRMHQLLPDEDSVDPTEKTSANK